MWHSPCEQLGHVSFSSNGELRRTSARRHVSVPVFSNSWNHEGEGVKIVQRALYPFIQLAVLSRRYIAIYYINLRALKGFPQWEENVSPDMNNYNNFSLVWERANQLRERHLLYLVPRVNDNAFSFWDVSKVYFFLLSEWVNTLSTLGLKSSSIWANISEHFTTKARPQHRELHALLFTISVWVLLRPLLTIWHWRCRRRGRRFIVLVREDLKV